MPNGDWTQVDGRLEQFTMRSTILSAPATCTPDSGQGYTTDGGLLNYVRVLDNGGNIMASEGSASRSPGSVHFGRVDAQRRTLG